MPRPRPLSDALDRGRSSPFARFFRSEAIGGVLLLLFTLAALAWANSPWSASYLQFLHAEIGVSVNRAVFALSWDHWINDGLMGLFFFVVGLEIKREILIGELSSIRRAVLPVAAALGGMALPAAIYAAFNRGSEGAHGWGIPMATDIAFALGILALLGPRVPAGLKVFLTALAIADDMGSVLVIAVFYTDRVSPVPLLAAALFLLAIVFALRRNVKRRFVYVILANCVWLSVLLSGVHATVAGILLALVVPVRSRIRPAHFLSIARETLAEFEAAALDSAPRLTSEQIDVLDRLHHATGDVVPAGVALERHIHPVAAYFVLPLFALFNAGIVVDSHSLAALAHPVGLGVMLGLVLGKQAGIFLAAWLVVRARLAVLPGGVTWGQIHGAAILGGIGFTMALFVSDLAFRAESLHAYSKTGILAGSVVSAVAGYVVLRSALNRSGSPDTRIERPSPRIPTEQ
jgi:NhaA family Na+:H+ antiporter